jgi:hypothetical protein
MLESPVRELVATKVQTLALQQYGQEVEGRFMQLRMRRQELPLL